MRAILDNHTLIWAQDDPAKLGNAASGTILSAATQLYVSTATIWEIGIKIAVGKLKLSQRYRPWLERAIIDLDLVVLQIDIRFVEYQIGLPFHHRDPFDRLLAAQSLVEGVSLISGDVVFDAYGVNRIWN